MRAREPEDEGFVERDGVKVHDEVHGDARLTDFVGWVPMPDGGPQEAHLTADYNADMLEQIDRYPHLRDRSVFVGNADDVIPGTFGHDLPEIRSWVDEHYDYAGSVTGFDPAELGVREKLRAEMGYRPDEQVCFVTVGGSGVGAHLRRRSMAAYPAARAALPHLRMVVVTGPRIEPSTLPSCDGLEVRPYDYDTATPDDIASAIEREIGRDTQYRPVETDGAHSAAALLAELL